MKAIITYCSCKEGRVEIPGYEEYTIHEFTAELVLKLIKLNPHDSFSGVVVDEISHYRIGSGTFWLFDEAANPHGDQEYTTIARQRLTQEQLDHFLANYQDYIEIKIHDYYLDS